jgi:hypothetical protein
VHLILARRDLPDEGRIARAVNAEIARIAGPDRTIVLEPDFEAVAGLAGHNH